MRFRDIIKKHKKKTNDWDLKKGVYDYPTKDMVDHRYFNPELHENIIQQSTKGFLNSLS